MRAYSFMLLIGAALFAAPCPNASALEPVLTRIAFGSCARENKVQPIWDSIVAARPELFVFFGDNVYLDTRDPKVMREKYAAFAAKPGFKKLRARTPVIATWDDHDFGEDDAGSDYPMKEETRRQFLDFWKEPKDSPRRERDGIYTSYYYGPIGQRVQIILLDLRFNRTPIKVDARWGDTETYDRWYEQQKGKSGEVPGPYVRNADPNATMLGETQWRWLEDELRKPADLRIIGSSLQVLADFPAWEAWANYVDDQQRLFELIRHTKARGVVFISGDTHYGELTVQRRNVPYPLWDLTSSGLTETWPVAVPNAKRLGAAHSVANFGMLEVDWQRREIAMQLRDAQGATLLGQVIAFDTGTAVR
jgi:alkaline phosphatase D